MANHEVVTGLDEIERAVRRGLAGYISPDLGNALKYLATNSPVDESMEIEQRHIQAAVQRYIRERENPSGRFKAEKVLLDGLAEHIHVPDVIAKNARRTEGDVIHELRERVQDFARDHAEAQRRSGSRTPAGTPGR